jgi:hypothetical protein
VRVCESAGSRRGMKKKCRSGNGFGWCYDQLCLGVSVGYARVLVYVCVGATKEVLD